MNNAIKTFSWLFAAMVMTAFFFVMSVLLIYNTGPLATETEQRKSGLTATALTAHRNNQTPPHILFTGDVMLGRYVETLMDTHGASYPFEHINDVLQGAETVVANLEGPISEDHKQTPNKSFVFSFDERVTRVLKDHNMGIVSLANNHTDDQGFDSLLFTQKKLSEEGIYNFGHPTSIDAENMHKTTVHGVNFSFFGFNAAYPSFNLSKAVTLLKRQTNEETYDIVSIHWGEEYQLQANNIQQEIAHSLIDAGADVIIGHHPHVVQNIELYRNKVIFYSLGNFIFDQYFSQDVEQGLVVEFTAKKDGPEFIIHPLESSLSQPRIMKKADRDTFLNELALRSQPDIQNLIQGGRIQIKNNLNYE